MIPFEEALRIVLDAAWPLTAESVDLQDAVGRVLAEDVRSDMDMPPFNKSAMDGYACRYVDIRNALRVVETIPAGQAPTRAIGENECAKIMTGAPVPDGADCVIMVEYTEPSGPGAIRFTGKESKSNICLRGEDIQAGDVVASRGTLITEQHIAVLASVGCTRPVVARRPRVGVVATGDELVEPSVVPGPSKIRNSNAYQLMAQIARAGGIPVYCGIAADTEEALTPCIAKATAENDVILLSGGVSAGDYDLVPPVLREQGFELLFEKVATKPGMPTVFGRSPTCFCFGLPGNPVSTFILFETLVRPFVLRLMGHDYRPKSVRLPLAASIRRKKVNRAAWTPVAVTPEGKVVSVEYHGSAHVGALCEADGLICVPVGTSEISEDTLVDVRQI